MTSEKKLRQELDEMRNELKKVQNYAKLLRKKCSEDEVSLKFFETKKKKKKHLSILLFDF